MGKGAWVLDFSLTSIVVLIAMTIAHWKAERPDDLSWLKSDRTTHLGAEYNCIAKSIVAGRGFCDPFHELTGPTAWMPPVLPYLLAAVYWLTENTESAAIELVITVQIISIHVAGMIVLREARRLRMTWLGLLIIIASCAANFHELFQKTHDGGLLLLLVSILWLGMTRVWYLPLPFGLAVLWGLFGGLCALSSPVVGATWAFLTGWRWIVAMKFLSTCDCSSFFTQRTAETGRGDYCNGEIKKAPHNHAIASLLRWEFMSPFRCRSPGLRRGLVAAVIAASTSILVIAPWTIRNRIALGHWMPIKSNGMYELWQSQCLDDDGVLDMTSLGQHPWRSNGELRQHYSEVGEVRFINEKGSDALDSIARNPQDFLIRIARRLAVASVYYLPLYRVDALRGGGWPLLFKRLVFPFPVIGLLLVLSTRRFWREPTVAAAVAIWCLVLLPYVLISYYDRYAIPVIGMKMLLVIYGADSMRQVKVCSKSYWCFLSSQQGREADAAGR